MKIKNKILNSEKVMSHMATCCYCVVVQEYFQPCRILSYTCALYMCRQDLHGVQEESRIYSSL